MWRLDVPTFRSIVLRTSSGATGATVGQNCLLNAHKIIFEIFRGAYTNKVNVQYTEQVHVQYTEQVDVQYTEQVMITYWRHVSKIMTIVLVYKTVLIMASEC